MAALQGSEAGFVEEANARPRSEVVGNASNTRPAPATLEL
jgi:hypothetical protein